MDAKRIFDITFCLGALILLFPALIIIAILVRFSSKGPIIYKSNRIGYNRRRNKRRSKSTGLEIERRNGDRRIVN